MDDPLIPEGVPVDRLLDELIATRLPDDSDDIAPDAHQDVVTAVAEEYLLALASDGSTGPIKMTAVFAKHPLLGLEVTDEAIVLYKNRHSLWGNMSAQFGDPVLRRLMGAYEGYLREVRAFRGGRERKTTTPTLQGGQRRIPKSDAGAPALLPLTNALKEFRIGYFPALSSSPRRFSDLCCLLRDGKPVDIGEQKQLDMWRQEARSVDSALPRGTPEVPLPGWPPDAELAVRAALLIDAGGTGAVARTVALQSLRLNPYCTLALQLLAIDSRPRGVMGAAPVSLKRDAQSNAPPVPPPASTNDASEQKKPWWRVW